MKILVGTLKKWEICIEPSLINALNKTKIPFEIVKANNENELAKLIKNSYDLKKYQLAIVIDSDSIFSFMYLAKFPQFIPARISDGHSAYMTRLHNDANILLFSAELMGWKNLIYCLQCYLKSHFEGKRHMVRIDMLKGIR